MGGNRGPKWGVVTPGERRRTRVGSRQERVQRQQQRVQGTGSLSIDGIQFLDWDIDERNKKTIDKVSEQVMREITTKQEFSCG